MPEQTDPRLRFLSRQDLAEITGVSMPVVDSWIHNPDESARLPSFRPNGGMRILIRFDDFEEWLETQRTRGKAAVRATRSASVR